MDGQNMQPGVSAEEPTELERFLAQMLNASAEVADDYAAQVSAGLRRGDSKEEGPRERPMTPEEAQLATERAAVEAVWDDVRACSAEGRLVTPGRWEETGMAPAHLDPDRFAVLVFDTLEACREGRPFEGSGQPVVAGDSACEDGTDGPRTPGDPAVEDVAEGAKGPGEVPAVEGTEGADVPAAEGVGSASSPTSEDAGDLGADASASAGEDLEEGMGEGSPAWAEEGVEEYAGKEPGQLCACDAAEEADWVEPHALEEARAPLSCDDVVVLEGRKDVYLYARGAMSENFAHWAFLAAEDDDLLTLVDNVRQESSLYPRPMLAAAFGNPPYRWTRERTEAAFEAVQACGAYPDIARVMASNGDAYYYSTDYLSAAQARALAQWYSVEKPLNV